MIAKEIKKGLWSACKEILESRLLRLRESMQRAQEEANLETKSSAGDKYETNRSMMQLEKERYALQHVRLQKMYTKLLRIDVSSSSQEIQLGSLVSTSMGWFFFGVGLGEVEYEGTIYRCISMKTPIGEVLEGGEEGDIVDFRDREVEVFDVI